MLSCQKDPNRHAYAWQIGPFWQDTLDICFVISSSYFGNPSGMNSPSAAWWCLIVWDLYGFKSLVYIVSQPAQLTQFKKLQEAQSIVSADGIVLFFTFQYRYQQIFAMSDPFIWHVSWKHKVKAYVKMCIWFIHQGAYVDFSPGSSSH